MKTADPSHHLGLSVRASPSYPLHLPRLQLSVILPPTPPDRAPIAVRACAESSDGHDVHIQSALAKNGSKCYDGRTQDVPEDAVVESDRERAVGESVRVEWGNRFWNAVVLEKRLAPSPLDQALPAKRQAAPRQGTYVSCHTLIAMYTV